MPSTSILDPAPPTHTAPTPRRHRGRRPAVAVVAFALAVTGVAYLVRIPSADPVVGSYVEFPLPDAPSVDTAPLAPDAPVGIALADAATQATIDRLEASPATPGALSLLARLLLQRAAVTGDVDTYSRATAALDRALALSPEDLSLRAQRAAARIAIHDFAGAAADADRVLARRPADPGALGASFDAAVETGDYTLASDRLVELGRLGPDAPQVLFRQARWAALNGDPVGAANLAARARVAADAGGTVGTARASYDLLAGKLALDEGRYSAALGAYEAALTAAPGWHAALAGLGRARAASGDLVGAEAALALAADTVPLPDTLSALGDVRTALGDTSGAEVAYGTVDVVARISAVQRLFSRAIVVSRADRGVDTAAAVRDARAEYRVRHDIYGADALGWALLADGRPRLAVRYADTALALGTLDPRLLAHAGLAHVAIGDVDTARALLTRALTLSPDVDPRLMPRVRAALAALPAGDAR